MVNNTDKYRYTNNPLVNDTIPYRNSTSNLKSQKHVTLAKITCKHVAIGQNDQIITMIDFMRTKELFLKNRRKKMQQNTTFTNFSNKSNYHLIKNKNYVIVIKL